MPKPAATAAKSVRAYDTAAGPPWPSVACLIAIRLSAASLNTTTITLPFSAGERLQLGEGDAEPAVAA